MEVCQSNVSPETFMRAFSSSCIHLVYVFFRTLFACHSHAQILLADPGSSHQLGSTKVINTIVQRIAELLQVEDHPEVGQNRYYSWHEEAITPDLRA